MTEILAIIEGSARLQSAALLLLAAGLPVAAAATGGLSLHRADSDGSLPGTAGRTVFLAVAAAATVSMLRVALALGLEDREPPFPWGLLLRVDGVAIVGAALLIGFLEVGDRRAWVVLGAAAAALLTWLGATWVEPLRVDGPLQPAAAALSAGVLSALLLSAGSTARLVDRVRRASIRTAFDDLVVCDDRGNLLSVSDAARTSLGLPARSRRPFSRAEAAPPALRELLRSPGKRRVRVRTGAGRVFDAWATDLLPWGIRRRVRGLLIRDVTTAHRDKRRLVRLAHYDSLTGLPNRRLLLETLTKTLAAAAAERKRAALYYIDLDDFKAINDSLGHGAGDRMLRALAERFVSALKPDEVIGYGISRDAQLTVARLAGDEFAVIASRVGDGEVAADLAGWIQEVSRRPLEVSGRVLTPSASIGYALYPDDGRDVETLLQRADSALYVAKSRGRRRFARYDASFDARADRARRLEEGLRKAIERGEMRVFYQPKLDTFSGTIVGLEALLRWRSLDLGDIGPADFIPVAEERGLIDEIGAWCMNETCRQIRAWADAGHRIVPVSVNVSSAQFTGCDLQRVVSDALKNHGVNPEHLELELTESLLLDERIDVELVLRDLRSVGVKIALDDFGTGYSALTYLNRFSLDVLKMDRGLLRDIDSNPAALGIVTAVVSMAHSLGLTVVAEGVDVEEQIGILQNLGCDQIQGFIFAPALPPDEIAQHLGRCNDAPRPYGPGLAAPGRRRAVVEDGLEDAPASVEPIVLEVDEPVAERPIAMPGRVLLIDDGSGNFGSLAMRLGRLGIEIHYAAEIDEARLFVVQESEKIRLVAVPPTTDIVAVRTMLDDLAHAAGERRKLVVIGERPDEEARTRIREAGVDWVLWAPFNDAELRHLLRSAMAPLGELADRRELRVPVDFTATVRCGTTRVVAVVSSLSARGAFIEMSEPFPEKSALRIEIELPRDRFRGFGRVVHVEKNEPSGVGVAFYAVDRDTETLLRKTIQELDARYAP